MDSYYQGRTNFSDVISQGRSPPIPYNMIVSKHLHLYVLAVHSYVTSIDILLLKAILITLNISSERYRKSLKMWISFIKQIWKKTLVKKRAPVHRLVRLDFNPIQDGHFPGCSRMGRGGKKTPLPKNHKSSNDETWHSYTLPKEDPKNIWITWHIPWLLLTSVFFNGNQQILLYQEIQI